MYVPGAVSLFLETVGAQAPGPSTLVLYGSWSQGCLPTPVPPPLSLRLHPLPCPLWPLLRPFWELHLEQEGAGCVDGALQKRGRGLPVPQNSTWASETHTAPLTL